MDDESRKEVAVTAADSTAMEDDSKEYDTAWRSVLAVAVGGLDAVQSSG